MEIFGDFFFHISSFSWQREKLISTHLILRWTNTDKRSMLAGMTSNAQQHVGDDSDIESRNQALAMCSLPPVDESLITFEESSEKRTQKLWPPREIYKIKLKSCKNLCTKIQSVKFVVNIQTW